MTVKEMIKELSKLDPDRMVEFEIPRNSSVGDRYPVEVVAEANYSSSGRWCVLKFEEFSRQYKSQ
jgi:hypothetical protein